MADDTAGGPVGRVDDSTEDNRPDDTDTIGYAEATLAPSLYLFYHAPGNSAFADEPTYQLVESIDCETRTVLRSDALSDVDTAGRVTHALSEDTAKTALQSHARGVWDYVE